jgi:nucleoside-diphosphate-sugar epimerase
VADKKLLVITGAAGRIGTAMRPFLRERYALRLVDVRPVADIHADEESSVADLSDFDATERAIRGAHAVLHLAGDPSTAATWPAVREHNIDATFNVLESARRTGANKVVFASTNHVMGFYYLESKLPIDDRSAVRPDSLYGVSKAFGEVLGRYFADAFGLSVICIRIGWFTPGEPNVGRLNPLWISPRDLAQLFGLALETPRQFGVYNGTSANRDHHWDLRSAMDELGYLPQDDVATFARPGPELPYVDPRAGILRAWNLAADERAAH